MPAASVVLATALHVSIIAAFLWPPSRPGPTPMPDDAVDVTIERQTAPLVAMIRPAAIATPEVNTPPIQAPATDRRQTAIRQEAVQSPTLENAVAEPESAPEPTLHDFAELKPILPKVGRMRPSPAPDPAADLDKAFVPPPGWTPPTASPPDPFLNQGNVVRHRKAADDYLARVAKKISQYRYYGGRNYVGRMFTTLVIARSGRLVSADILIPSENAGLDAEVMETIRLAAPYEPLPDKIEGEQATFILPCQYLIRAAQ